MEDMECRNIVACIDGLNKYRFLILSYQAPQFPCSLLLTDSKVCGKQHPITPKQTGDNNAINFSIFETNFRGLRKGERVFICGPGDIDWVGHCRTCRRELAKLLLSLGAQYRDFEVCADYCVTGCYRTSAPIAYNRDTPSSVWCWRLHCKSLGDWKEFIGTENTHDPAALQASIRIGP